MVNFIDIHKLNLEELSGVISMHPWYAGARRELCARMARNGALSDILIGESAMYMGSTKVLSDLLRQETDVDYTDTSAPEAVEKEETREQGPTIFVVGGDYFSQKDYEKVKEPEDNIFSKFATKAYEGGYIEPLSEDNEGIYTETMAQIYLEQDYPEQAKEIYNKLILRYPEKSVYFANLIDEINKKVK
ncbi:MAG: hypothetical protein KBS67_05155 [Bacteroidales bacterium]|nr:hypothetical protein [Candidatus Cryptobacteroides equifaecalis]